MEWYKTEDGKYRIESLSAATFHGALNVIEESFCRDEYVCIGSEVNKNPEAVEELLELCADAALDGVSLVAVEAASGEVVSVAFNKIQVLATDSSEKPFFEIFAEERCKQASSQSLIQFMATVDERCNLFEKCGDEMIDPNCLYRILVNIGVMAVFNVYGVDCSLEIMFLATLRQHRKNKLATLLCQISIDVAKKLRDGPVASLTVADLGPKYANLKPRKTVANVPKICQAIWTSEGSQRVGSALNFTVHLTVPLSEFVFNDKTYSERIGNESAFCEVAAILL